MKNVLERDISVVLSKNDFITSRSRLFIANFLVMLKSLKAKRFMKEEEFDYSLHHVMKVMKERKRTSRYNK